MLIVTGCPQSPHTAAVVDGYHISTTWLRKRHQITVSCCHVLVMSITTLRKRKIFHDPHGQISPSGA